MASYRIGGHPDVVLGHLRGLVAVTAQSRVDQLLGIGLELQEWAVSCLFKRRELETKTV